MQTPFFRTANPNDAKAIAQLVNNAYRPESGAQGWTHESELVSGNRTGAGQVRDAMARENSAMLLGLIGVEIVACVHIEKDGGNAHIGMLAVNPDLQGAGIGKAMLAQAEAYASRNFKPEKFVMVVVSSRNELVSFYLRRGYQKTGVVTDYPLSAGAGTPKISGLKVEVLEKSSISLQNGSDIVL